MLSTVTKTGLRLASLVLGILAPCWPTCSAPSATPGGLGDCHFILHPRSYPQAPFRQALPLSQAPSSATTAQAPRVPLCLQE